MDAEASDTLQRPSPEQMEKLEEEQMLQAQQHEKELELEKLRMAKELLDARMDIKRAELEAPLETESESDPESEIFPGLPRQSPQDGVDNYLKLYQPLPRAGAVPTPSLQPPPPKAPSTLDEAATGKKLERISSRHTTTISLITLHCNKSLSVSRTL